MARRYGVAVVGFDRFELEVEGLDRDERCECGCHAEDEDGRSDWDDDEP
jgi:hypothetical protein